jgi:hypothetical protein
MLKSINTLLLDKFFQSILRQCVTFNLAAGHLKVFAAIKRDHRRWPMAGGRHD